MLMILLTLPAWPLLIVVVVVAIVIYFMYRIDTAPNSYIEKVNFDIPPPPDRTFDKPFPPGGPNSLQYDLMTAMRDVLKRRVRKVNKRNYHYKKLNRQPSRLFKYTLKKEVRKVSHKLAEEMLRAFKESL
jgi:hypothetical protein